VGYDDIGLPLEVQYDRCVIGCAGLLRQSFFFGVALLQRNRFRTSRHHGRNAIDGIVALFGDSVADDCASFSWLLRPEYRLEYPGVGVLILPAQHLKWRHLGTRRGRGLGEVGAASQRCFEFQRALANVLARPLHSQGRDDPLPNLVERLLRRLVMLAHLEYRGAVGVQFHDIADRAVIQNPRIEYGIDDRLVRAERLPSRTREAIRRAYLEPGCCSYLVQILGVKQRIRYRALQVLESLFGFDVTQFVFEFGAHLLERQRPACLDTVEAHDMETKLALDRTCDFTPVHGEDGIAQRLRHLRLQRRVEGAALLRRAAVRRILPRK